MDEPVAISIRNVYKNFRLPHERVTSVKSFFVNPFQSRNASKTETQHALHDVSFDVKEGEFFGIVGRNGSGKSTLLKIIAGIYQPTKGSVNVRGRLVPFIELGVGFNPELTGRENVYLNGALMGFSEKEVDAMYDDIVSFAELEKFMDQKLKNYSSGMQVRLAFSVATRSEADVLLVDEVLAVGDADFQRKCFSFFKELKRKHKTIIFISHDMNSIREYCDRALLIDNSKVLCEGDPVKVAAEYSKLFLETADGEGTVDSERWGDQAAEATNLDVKIVKDKIRLSFDLRANKNLEDIIIGYVIANEVGQQICGKNTQMLGEKIPDLAKGSARQINFSIDNVFNDGNYDITLAILYNNGTSTADWWTNAARITIKKEQRNPYLIDIPTMFSLKEKQDER